MKNNVSVASTIRNCAIVLTTVASLVATPAAAQTFTEYPVPTASGGPGGITTGPDGALWFVEQVGKIARISTNGTISEFAIPTSHSSPQCIVNGPDGALWFVEGDGNKIGRITTGGTITEFVNFAGGWPQCLTVGPDGALWIADQGPKGGGAASGDGWIGRITTAGVLTKFPIISTNSQPSWIVVGPDGALWFTIPDANKIGRITTAGTVTEYAVPTPSSYPEGITAGPDGALWFAESDGNKIGRITTAGTFTEYPLPNANSGPFWITVGPDGALWFTEPGVQNRTTWTFAGIGKIGRITTGGAITEYAVPTANSTPLAMTVGPDSALWFGEATGNKIGRLVPGATSISLASGWNLLGYSGSATIDLSQFSNTTNIASAWKWVPSKSAWAFYAPSLTAGALSTYASGKGYDVMTNINSGDGFWVNVTNPFTVQLPR